ncbi:contractile injection system protein, VgrG/Pvc8 family [Paraburkholderia sp.]|uniref:contractile injection system protein, VgrG/Pvc8 family n=1 Tax=Paraburkholderia sp. TaxID=1926495 RepID=UPI0025EE5E5D|nr:contractile injection system protein, VgrG/Pvc8 family [Paraburkholderia sp.]
MNIAPSYSLTANDSDITAIISDRFVSLSLRDESGENTDTLEITLADNDPDAPIAFPPTGAELALSLGYDGKLTPKGVFVCDEITCRGWPAQLIISAKAAPWDQTPKGKIDFQSHKTRSWKAGTTIGAMVRTIASEHGMTSVVAPSLAGIALPHIDQSEESDMNLLLRVAKKYDAIAKPAGGKMIFAARGASQTASGADLPRIPITASDDSTFEMRRATRESAGTVVAYWHDKRAAKRQPITAGSGEPVKRLKQYFPTADMAMAAAKAELAKRSRHEYRISLNIPGDPRITAEAILDLSGFRQYVNGAWLITRAEHLLDKGAYRCVIEGERPNDDVVMKVVAARKAASAAPNGNANDAVAGIRNQAGALMQQANDLKAKGDAADAAGDSAAATEYWRQSLSASTQSVNLTAQADKLDATQTIG